MISKSAVRFHGCLNPNLGWVFRGPFEVEEGGLPPLSKTC